MLSQKKFSTFSEQVEWLQNEKHLTISNKQYAEDVLKHIGYFPLMGSYKHLFRIPLTKKCMRSWRTLIYLPDNRQYF